MAEELVVSLTSYPARIRTVHLTIETLLRQSRKPDVVVLWLAPEQFPGKERDLPQSLLALQDKGLSIEWYHDIKSYKKLIPSLKKWPSAIIVTADDDILYPPDMLDALYNTYENHLGEKVVVSNSVSRLYMKNDELFFVGSASCYLDKESRCLPEVVTPSVFNKLRGGSGALYPPGCMSADIFDEEKFMRLAPTSDDLYFFICALRNGYKVAVPREGKHKCNIVDGTQETALSKINDARGGECFTQHLHNLTKGDERLLKRFREEHDSNLNILLSLIITDFFARQQEDTLAVDEQTLANLLSRYYRNLTIVNDYKDILLEKIMLRALIAQTKQMSEDIVFFKNEIARLHMMSVTPLSTLKRHYRILQLKLLFTIGQRRQRLKRKKEEIKKRMQIFRA